MVQRLELHLHTPWSAVHHNQINIYDLMSGYEEPKKSVSHGFHWHMYTVFCKQ